jgi:pyruvate kinase
VAAAAADLADAIHSTAIIAFTSSGTTVARIARKRPITPILALTPDLQVARRLCLLWGAHSECTDELHSYEDMIRQAQTSAIAAEFGKPHDQVVVVAGIPFRRSGSTNNLRVLKLD